MAEAGLRKLATAGAVGIVGALVASLFGWLRVKALAEFLGPADLGLYGQLWAFALYAGALASLGFGVATTNLIAVEREKGSSDSLSEVARASIVMPWLGGSALTVLTIAFAAALSPLLIASHDGALIVLAALSIPFVAVQLPLQHILQGFEDVRGQAATYALYAFGFTAFSVCGALLFSLRGAVFALACGNVLLAVLYGVRTRRLLSQHDARLRLSPFQTLRHRWMRTLFRLGIASLVITLAFSLADFAVRTAVLHFEGRHAAGLWFALLIVSLQGVGLITGAMSYLVAPLAARVEASLLKTAEGPRLLDDALRLSLMVVVPLLALMTVSRSPLVSILFSADFADLTAYFPAQMAGDALRTIAWTLGVALVPLGFTRTWLFVGVGSSLLYGIIGVVAVMQWGLGGAVASWIAMWGSAAIVCSVVLFRNRAWRPSGRTLLGLAATPMLLGVATALPNLIGLAGVVLGTGLLFGVVAKENERAAVVNAALRIFRAARTGKAQR